MEGSTGLRGRGMSIVQKKDKNTVTVEDWAIVWVKVVTATIRTNCILMAGYQTFEEQAGEILRDLLSAGWTAPNKPKEE